MRTNAEIYESQNKEIMEKFICNRFTAQSLLAGPNNTVKPVHITAAEG